MHHYLIKLLVCPITAVLPTKIVENQHGSISDFFEDEIKGDAALGG